MVASIYPPEMASKYVAVAGRYEPRFSPLVGLLKGQLYVHIKEREKLSARQKAVEEAVYRAIFKTKYDSARSPKGAVTAKSCVFAVLGVRQKLCHRFASTVGDAGGKLPRMCRLMCECVPVGCGVTYPDSRSGRQRKVLRRTCKLHKLCPMCHGRKFGKLFDAVHGYGDARAGMIRLRVEGDRRSAELVMKRLKRQLRYQGVRDIATVCRVHLVATQRCKAPAYAVWEVNLLWIGEATLRVRPENGVTVSGQCSTSAKHLAARYLVSFYPFQRLLLRGKVDPNALITYLCEMVLGTGRSRRDLTISFGGKWRSQKPSPVGGGQSASNVPGALALAGGERQEHANV